VRQDLSFTCSRCGRDLERYAVGRDTGAPICKSCYLKDLTVPEAVRKIDEITTAVMTVEPHLSRAVVVAAVEASVSTIHGLSKLARQVTSDPALLHGSALATRTVFRLIDHLIEAGATRVSRPRCAKCSREGPLTNSRCQSCAPSQVPCSYCGRRHRVHSRTTTREPLCKTCHYRDPANWKVCSSCGNLGRINARAEDGGAICMRCYRQPLGNCEECGDERPITSRNHGQALCSTCYVRVGPKRPCGRCGRVRRIAKKATVDQPELCYGCWWEPIAVCSRCGNEGMCNGIKKGAPLCLRCRLDDRITAALTGPDGTIAEALAPVREAVLAVDNPRSGHVWMGRSPAVEVLAKIASGELDLSHDALDDLRQTAAIIHLRDLLMSVGLLPPRDPLIARIEGAITRRADELSEENSKALRSFGMWSVMRRARRKADLGRLTVNGAKSAVTEIHEAARFLSRLESEGKPLSGVTQADIDAWLSSGVKARYKIRGFLLWALRRRLCTGLIVPVLGAHETPNGVVDHEARWALARRLLHDETIDPGDRVAGALVVIYAQRLSYIARLTRADVVERDGEVFIRLGKEDVLMPEPLGPLLRDLPWRRQIGIAGMLHATEWLFPGRQAGRHQHPEYLRVRLSKLGIDCRAQRRAALLQLASQVPAAVLADMLNIAPSTAAKWVDWAGGNWTNYAAERVRVTGGRGRRTEQIG
jgi:hypothetical protein